MNTMNSNNNNIFMTGGSFGDSLYSLCVVKILGGGEMYVKLNAMDEGVRKLFGREPEGYHKGRYTQKDAEMLIPLLEAQDYLTKVGIYTDQKTTHTFEDHWKMHLLKGWQGNQTECYALTQGWDIYDPALSKKLLLEPWLTPVDPIKIPGKPVVINRTNRYLYGCNGEQWVDWVSKGLGDYAVFIGTPDEHEAFEKDFNVKIEYRPIKDLLEMAQIIQGCEQFMGNQSVALCIAIGLGKTFWCETRKDWHAFKSPHGWGDVWFPRINGHYF
jgi:hypothetical protein